MVQTANKKAINQVKDDKQKKKFDSWGFYLAWGAAIAGLLSAGVTLAKRMDAPKKDDFYI